MVLSVFIILCFCGAVEVLLKLLGVFEGAFNLSFNTILGLFAVVVLLAFINLMIDLNVDGKIYGIQVFQPIGVRKRQKEFIRNTYPFSNVLGVVLCVISGTGFTFWIVGIHPDISKLIGVSVFLVLLLFEKHYLKQYDTQADCGFKRV